MENVKGAELPGKEGNLFKQIIKHHEAKNYKKGIKTADKILEKYPMHGETLALKGLLLSQTNKMPEAT